MSNIVQNIKKLRDETGLGILDIRDALAQADGDLHVAHEILSKKLDEVRQTEASIKNKMMSAYFEDVEAPITKGDFYELEYKLETLEHRMEESVNNIEMSLSNIESLLTDLVELVNNLAADKL